MTKCTIFSLLLLFAISLPMSADEIGFVEDFALAKDREKVLQQLIPGTDDYYFYNCLNFQNKQQFDKVETMLKPWIERHGENHRVIMIRNRQALLMYSDNPKKSLEYIRRHLGLNFNHQRNVVGKKPALPSVMDQALISRQRLKQLAFRNSSNTSGFENRALFWLASEKLTADQRRDWLNRLQHPDAANLIDLISKDLDYKRSRGFGSLNIHRNLTRDQLWELVKKKPRLLNESNFVNEMLATFHPNPDVDLNDDEAAYQSYLTEVTAFAKQLGAVHNSLKTNILFQQLKLDAKNETFNRAKFMEYIKLPRNAYYINPKVLEALENRRHSADLNASFGNLFRCPPIRNDEPIVREYLMHFFKKETDFKTYVPWIRDDYLKRVFAETKIVNGLGDQEKWYSLLSPSDYQNLKQRVDLDFTPNNAKLFAPDDNVSIELFTKNIETLIIKVFEINTQNYYRSQLTEVETDISLDGLVPNFERVVNYDEPPLRRVRRKFDFPELDKAGVYVVDFIGNGKSSRALIRKGKLRYISEVTPDGQQLQVFDQADKQVKKAKVWLGGREFVADKEGTIQIPFSTKPGSHRIVISSGDLHSIDTLEHLGETYRFDAAFFVDRESLIRGNQSNVLIRPSLKLNGIPISTEQLKDVRLTVTSTDLDGVSASKEETNFRLPEDREALFEFRVPDRLRSISFSLTAKTEMLTTGKEVQFSASRSFAVNKSDETANLGSLFLVFANDRYFVEYRGKNGESFADRAIQISLKHEDFRSAVNVSLKSDESGRVQLGTLDGIASITVSSNGAQSETWQLKRDNHTFYGTMNVKEGDAVSIPYLGDSKKAERSEFAVYSVHNGTFVEDLFDKISIENGMLVLKGLSRGDYDLFNKLNQTRQRIQVTQGERFGQTVMGVARRLEIRGENPLHVKQISSTKDKLKIEVNNSTKLTRVHIFANRFRSAHYDPFFSFSNIRDAEPALYTISKTMSQYMAGRKIGDEYQYILDRKYATKFAGNMLKRPGLILNPWEARSTSTSRQEANSGSEFSKSDSGGMGGRSSRSRSAKKSSGNNFTDHANLDFLTYGSPILLNLEPKDGVIELDLKVLDGRQDIMVLAVDPVHTTARSYSIPEGEVFVRDVRLTKGLSPTEHFTQQKSVDVVAKGEEFVLENVASSRFDTYDDLSGVYRLLMTLSSNNNLAKFNFVLSWPEKTMEEKRALYSEHACHELNFFIYKKDRDFFNKVVAPFLQNKMDRTYLDEWFLQEGVEKYLDPWKFDQLNVVERILLGKSLPDEQKASQRHVSELYEMSPTSREDLTRLFDFSIVSGVLDSDDDELQAMKTLNIDGKSSRGTIAGGVVKEVEAKLAQVENSFGATYDSPAASPSQPSAAKPMNRPEKKSKAEVDRSRNIAMGRKGVDKYYKDQSASEEYAGKEPSRSGSGPGSERLLKRRSGRSNREQLYRQLDKTMEFAENNYYRLMIQQQNADLVKVDQFWRDYANHNPDEPFFSSNFSETAGNFTEMMFALSVLDLPFAADKHESEFKEQDLHLTAASPMIVFHEQIKPAIDKRGGDTTILVSQNFFRMDDRYQYDGPDRLDKFVRDEFLTKVAYGAQVVVTNPTSSPQKVEVLLQIPVGAIPLQRTRKTNSLNVTLAPYRTQSLEYYFYFPEAGDFEHYPIHVSKNEDLLAFAEADKFHVVDKPTKIDTTSWAYVSQNGTNEDVLAFLETANLYRIDLNLIAFRMQDKEVFQKVTNLLRQRHVFNNLLWSYAIKHDSRASAAEYLAYQNGFKSKCGPKIESLLLSIDPVEQKTYEFFEYEPLVNARVHQLGKRRQILNNRFSAQYNRLLNIVAFSSEVDSQTKMGLCYYMLLQDRIEEAIVYFSQINPDAIPMRIQYDYLAAYMDMFNDKPERARQISSKYVNYPVNKWQKRFASVVAQLDEIEGKSTGLVDEKDRTQSQTQLASKAPTYDFKVEDKRVNLSYQNMSNVTVNYYEMDIELLFSRNPFVDRNSEQLAFVKPMYSKTVKLSGDSNESTWELPKELHSSNILVEVVAGEQTKSQAYFANAIDVQMVERFGQVKVVNSNNQKNMAKVYVKVYAKMKDGKIKFYKDGYTDLRGRFDYTSLSTNDLDFVDRFSVLVMSQENGAVVKEARPPKR